ncbi:MAG: flippase-like domain-containing protein [Bacteroidales bacterium]|nr:flippase-like domain-containing protein [Bacteroidales bacterium]
MKRKFNRKLLFNILVYISLLFLFLFLYRQGYFSFKSVTFNPKYLIISTVFLWGGYFFSSVSWWNILRRHQVSITLRQAVISHGLFIFAKYIPGKIWVILGRAGYVSGSKYSLKTTSFISMKEQLIYVWEGLLISLIPTLIIYSLSLFSVIVILLVVLMTIFLFSRKIHHRILKVLKRITRKEWEIPYIRFRESYGVLLYVLIYWIFWLAGFWLFVQAFYQVTDPIIAFAFPLSVVLGLLVVIFPGGIGVRESILTSYLAHAGVAMTSATVISIFARIWFIAGEVFIFLLALYLKISLKSGKG